MKTGLMMAAGAVLIAVLAACSSGAPAPTAADLKSELRACQTMQAWTNYDQGSPRNAVAEATGTPLFDPLASWAALPMGIRHPASVVSAIDTICSSVGVSDW